MGLFNKIGDIIKVAEKVSANVGNIMEAAQGNTGNVAGSQGTMNCADLLIGNSSRIVQGTSFGDNDSEYTISFSLDESFKEAKSHAGEIEMLYTYAPGAEYGEEDAYPCVAIQMDDKVYTAVSQFKEKGTFAGARELTPLTGRFLFKAKMDYYNYIMYFYGFDRLNGSWENNGLCMVYPKSYAGTANEAKLMRVLDEAAQSYNEERK